MKRLCSLLCALALLAALPACGRQDDAAAGGAIDEMTLAEVLEASLKDVPDLPKYEAVELTEENFEFFAFLPYEEGFEGLEADALISSTPHSVVLVRVPADRAEDAAAAIEENADPRKWICVEAEKTVVRQYGGTILLVMSSGEIANAILRNFDALAGVETPEADLAIPEPEEQELPEVVVFPGEPDEDAVTPTDDMPTLAPAEGEDGNMPAVEPGDEAVEMPTVKPDAGGEAAAAPQPQAEEPVEAPTTTPAAPAEEPVEVPAPTPEEPAAGTDLSAVMASLLSGVDGLPNVMEVELDADTFEFYAFIPYEDGFRGLVSEPLINARAHSVVLVEVPEGGDAAKTAEAMKSNADPRKWICVEAESVQAASNGRLALLVMSDQALADAIIANFNAL